MLNLPGQDKMHTCQSKKEIPPLQSSLHAVLRFTTFRYYCDVKHHSDVLKKSIVEPDNIKTFNPTLTLKLTFFHDQTLLERTLGVD